jgi:hypothetical protein
MGVIGSCLSRAWLVPGSQSLASQAQRMQGDSDWLLVCMWPGYAGKLIGWHA